MPKARDCSLVIVDVQGKLAELMYDREKLFSNIVILIKASKILNIPIMWCQQCPEALGPTVSKIAELLSDVEPINKSSFSCVGDAVFAEQLQARNPCHLILAGIETHICIYQTAVDLLKAGRAVTVVADAVSSRTRENRQIALEKIKTMGAEISSTEMLLFELLKNANHRDFKKIARLVK